MKESTKLITELRAKRSRDNRDLLDRAADMIAQLQRQINERDEQHDRELKRQHREYNIALDKMHLTYRELIIQAREAVLEDVKGHVQHPSPDARPVYVINDRQLEELYKKHGVGRAPDLQK
jgi:hypothetical protein